MLVLGQMSTAPEGQVIDDCGPYPLEGGGGVGAGCAAVVATVMVTLSSIVKTSLANNRNS